MCVQRQGHVQACTSSRRAARTATVRKEYCSTGFCSVQQCDTIALTTALVHTRQTFEYRKGGSSGVMVWHERRPSFGYPSCFERRVVASHASSCYSQGYSAAPLKRPTARELGELVQMPCALPAEVGLVGCEQSQAKRALTRECSSTKIRVDSYDYRAKAA